MGKDKDHNIVQRYYRPEPLLLELSHGQVANAVKWNETHLAGEELRPQLDHFPNVSEIEAVRHYTRLSRRNFSLEEDIYPLGSCTMKYNPRINESVAGLAGFKGLHPNQPLHLVQGALEMLYDLERCLCAITGMDEVSLQGATGSQGEYIGLKMIQSYHQHKGETRDKILIPDSAHGTNPASSALCNFKVVPIPSNREGMITVEQVAKVLDDRVAGLMVTIPNTLGIFETELVKIAALIRQRGAFVYGDGANLNALLCRVDFKKLGVDVMHMNLHKTFSTPHGGGGPGAGPVACVSRLAPHLPSPYLTKTEDGYAWQDRGATSIGRVKPYHGSFAMLLRAYAYILANGSAGLKHVSDVAVLNANYIRQKLKDVYDIPFTQPSLHEVVFSDKKQLEHGVSTMDVAKRLMDYGFHPPTVYFPLIVKGALMVEPTETTSRDELRRFVEVMRTIADEVKSNPESMHAAPSHVGMRRIDEVQAARKPCLTWNSHWHEAQ